MNNLTGTKASQSRGAKRVDGNDEDSMFRLIQQPKTNRFGHAKQRGDILADANYILHDNSCGDSQQMDGNQVIYYMQNFIGSLFIPRVLMRCTIIPV